MLWQTTLPHNACKSLASPTLARCKSREWKHAVPVEVPRTHSMHDGTCQVPAGHRELGFQELGNGLFLRGLPHESTVRRFSGICRVPYIIFAQWNSTLAGCLMSPPCKDVGVPFGFHISSFARWNRSLRSAAYGIRICYPAYVTPIPDKDFSFKHCHIRAVGQSGAPQVSLAEELRRL